MSLGAGDEEGRPVTTRNERATWFDGGAANVASGSLLPLIVLSLVAVAAHWPALQWGYANDDFALLHNGVDSELFVAQGRPVGWLLFRAMGLLGVPLTESAPAFQFAGNIVLATFAWTVVRLWVPELPVWRSAIAALPIIVHPYQSEIFSYRSTMLLTTFPLAMAAWFFHECRVPSSRWRRLAATGGLVIAIATYQAIVNYIGYVLLLYAATIAATSGLPWRDRDHWRKWTRVVALAALAAVVYLVGLKMLWSLVPHAVDERFDLRALPAVSVRMVQMARWGYTAFFGETTLLSSALKWIAFAGPLCLLVLALSRSPERPAAANSSARVLIVTLASFAAACFLIGGVSALTPTPWIVPRVLAQAGIVYAWLFVLPLSRLATGSAARPAVAVLAVISFLLAAMSVATLSSQLRVNLRDLHLAARIYERIEATTGFATANRLVVVGGRWAYGDPIKNVWGDLNPSAFIAPQSKGNVIVEVSGTRLVASTQIPDLETARGQCAHSEPWPSPQAVTIIERLVVVCMPTQE